MIAGRRSRQKDQSAMSDPSDCPDPLPTRQKNALRLLLGKPNFTPEEIAAIDYRLLERAPGVGKSSLAIIRAWLQAHGYEFKNLPALPANPRAAQRRRKLERAIDYLRWHGYEVKRSN